MQILRRAHRPISKNIPRYSHSNTFVKIKFSSYFLLSNTLEVTLQSYHIRGFNGNNIAGAIILTLMHRIPTEFCSKACSGESSTKMGDLLGSPRVAPLLPFYDEISMIYVRTCRANRFRPSHFHLDLLIVDPIPRS